MTEPDANAALASLRRLARGGTMPAAEFKKWRMSLGQQREVAEHLGTTNVTLWRRETGAVAVTREAALAILALVLLRVAAPALVKPPARVASGARA